MVAGESMQFCNRCIRRYGGRPCQRRGRTRCYNKTTMDSEYCNEHRCLTTDSDGFRCINEMIGCVLKTRTERIRCSRCDDCHHGSQEIMYSDYVPECNKRCKFYQDIPEWRPWNHSSCSDSTRRTVRTLAILARSFED